MIQLTCFCICFVKQGEGGSLFLRDPKGGKSLGLGGGHVLLRDPKGWGQKNSVNRNENLQIPPPHKNDTSLTECGKMIKNPLIILRW